MAQQTAVDYLIEQLQAPCRGIPTHIIEQAKQMEKKQIINAFGVGYQVESTRLIGYHGMAEQFYNETYNK